MKITLPAAAVTDKTPAKRTRTKNVAPTTATMVVTEKIPDHPATTTEEAVTLPETFLEPCVGTFAPLSSASYTYGRKVQPAPFESLHVELSITRPISDDNQNKEVLDVIQFCESAVEARIAAKLGIPVQGKTTPPKTQTKAPAPQQSEQKVTPPPSQDIDSIFQPEGSVPTPVYQQGVLQPQHPVSELDELDNL